MKILKLDITYIIKKVWRYFETALIILAAIFLIGWTIGPIKKWLEKNEIFDQSTIFDIVAITITLLISIISEVKSNIRELSQKLDKFNKESNSKIIENGVLHVYPSLNAILGAIEHKKEKTLDVIGITMYSAWPHIQAWISSARPGDWKIRLFILNSSFIKDHDKIMPSKWIKEAESAKDQIEYFISEKAALLESISTTIELIQYNNLPVIHGFKIGDGSLYVSFAHWSERNLLDDPHYFYEYFHSEDKTSRAKAYRDLFRNWVSHYSA